MATFLKLSPIARNAKHFALLEKVGSRHRREEKTSERSIYFLTHPFQIAD